MLSTTVLFHVLNEGRRKLVYISSVKFNAISLMQIYISDSAHIRLFTYGRKRGVKVMCKSNNN